MEKFLALYEYSDSKNYENVARLLWKEKLVRSFMNNPLYIR